MVARKRVRHVDETRDEDQPMSSSPLRRMHEDDVSGMEAMLRRRKFPKTTPETLVSSSSNSKMTWTKNDELIILGSIVDYEKETKLSYRSNWDAFYGYVKDFIEANFSKKQFIEKVRKLKKRFLDNQARFNNGKETSFANTEDDEIFKLSMIIWDTSETECVSNENIDQAKDVPCVEQERFNENMDHAKDVPCVEHERANESMDQEKVVRSAEHEQVNENRDQAKDVPCVEVEEERVNEKMDTANVDVPVVENEPVGKVSVEGIGEGEKEKSEEDGVGEFCALQDALEATTVYQSLGGYQQKLLLQKLKSLDAQRRKELSDEWKALLAEDMKLYAKKLTLSAKLAKAVGDSS